jgi:hypothetical protein
LASDLADRRRRATKPRLFALGGDVRQEGRHEAGSMISCGAQMLGRFARRTAVTDTLGLYMSLRCREASEAASI